MEPVTGYLTLEQASAYLHTSPSCIRGWVRTRNLPHFNPGKRLLFRTHELDRWMDQYRKGLAPMALAHLTQRRAAR